MTILGIGAGIYEESMLVFRDNNQKVAVLTRRPVPMKEYKNVYPLCSL